METPQPDYQRPSAPTEPIVVLGKDNTFLYPVPTVALAVQYTGRYLAGGKAMGAQHVNVPQLGRLRLDELDFFDGIGRRLEPVVEKGTLVGLTIKPDHQVEIRNRIRELLRSAGETLRAHPDASELAKSFPTMPSEKLSFEDFLDKIVNDERLRFDPERNCGFIEWITGRC